VKWSLLISDQISWHECGLRFARDPDMFWCESSTRSWLVVESSVATNESRINES